MIFKQILKCSMKPNSRIMYNKIVKLVGSVLTVSLTNVTQLMKCLYVIRPHSATIQNANEYRQ